MRKCLGSLCSHSEPLQACRCSPHYCFCGPMCFTTFFGWKVEGFVINLFCKLTWKRALSIWWLYDVLLTLQRFLWLTEQRNVPIIGILGGNHIWKFVVVREGQSCPWIWILGPLYGVSKDSSIFPILPEKELENHMVTVQFSRLSEAHGEMSLVKWTFFFF